MWIQFLFRVASLRQKKYKRTQSYYSNCVRYTGCIKKTEQIWNCSQIRKTAISIQFFIYMASLGTYNVEWWKKFREHKFRKPGGCVFSDKIKKACARDLKALIVFWVNGWKICWMFNCCTKFQTTCFSSSPSTIHANLHFP